MVTRAWQRLALPLSLCGLVLLAAWPVLRLGYPTAGDGLIHFYRLVQLDHLLRAGVWYPRWAADLAYGFGYPVFHYYSPLAYYAGALLHALGLSYANALLGVYTLALGLAATGAYALAADRWGRMAGLAAAAAYGLAPYFYFNALARGALPETVGLGLLPWVLWAHARLARQPTPGRFVAAALLNTALVLTHLLSAVLAAPLVVMMWFLENQDKRPSNYRLPVANYILSLGLAAFFLLPALLELNAVQALQLTTPGDLDFHNHFLALTQLLAWPRPYDARLVFNAVTPSLSVAAAALAGAGLMAPGTGPSPMRSRGHVAPSPRAAVRGARRWLTPEMLMATALLALVALALPLSVGVWERVPLLRLVQFPWRLVGPASLLLALLVGASVARAAARWRSGPLLPAGVLIVVWAWSLAWSYGPPSQAPASASLSDLHAYERTTGQLGTTSTGEFLPAAVHALPDPLTLAAAYANGRPTARLTALPAGVTVMSQDAGPTRAAAEVEATAPATLTFNLFYFPGWAAAVDGQPAAVLPSEPHGLITVAIPAGRHRVEVWFGSTPLRTAAGLLSLLAALTLVLLARRVPNGPSVTNSLTPSPPHPLTPTLAFALLFTRVLLLDTTSTPFARTRFDGANVAGVGQPLDVNFDNQLVLIGLEGLPVSLAADETVGLTLYWRAQTVPAADYATTVQVVDEAGHLFGQSDSQHPGRVPTSRWRTDQYARDEHGLRLLPGTPPGTYRLVAGVYQVGGPSLAVLDTNQVPQGHLTELGTVTVTRARRPAVPDPAHALDVPLGPLRLRGYSLNTAAPQAGELLRLTLFWQAESVPRSNAAVHLALLSADGSLLAETTQPPATMYPTSTWAAGEVVRHPLDLRVPADVSAGGATLTVSLVPAGTPGDPPLAGPVDLAALTVRVPERNYTPPAMQHVLNADVGAGVTLLGYDLAPTGAVTLYWQPQTLLAASCKVFVHALAADGRLVAQSDTVPASGTRPTTGWLPGEVIADTHALPLSGAARLAAGLYDETNGERLGLVAVALP